MKKIEKYPCQKCKKKFVPKRKPRKLILCPACIKKPTKFTCTKCGQKKKPPKNSREKTFVCSSCKKIPTKFKCSKCGIEDKPAKNSRKKTFLCKVCRGEKKQLIKILRSNKTINPNDVGSFLNDIGFQFSKKGIPYKYYGGLRLSISDTCGKLTMIVSSKGENDCYIDTSIQKILPPEAVIELKPVINTIINIWKN